MKNIQKIFRLVTILFFSFCFTQCDDNINCGCDAITGTRIVLDSAIVIQGSRTSALDTNFYYFKTYKDNKESAFLPCEGFPNEYKQANLKVKLKYLRYEPCPNAFYIYENGKIISISKE